MEDDLHSPYSDEAEVRLRKAAEGGSVDAMLDLGRLCFSRDDFTGAEAWFRKAAEGEDAETMLNLARYAHTFGDSSEAEGWFQKAAEAGSPQAMLIHGQQLAGRGALADEEHWYREAAKLNDYVGMNNLAEVLCQKGELDEAEMWARRAVDQATDDLIAMSTLGEILQRKGLMVEAESLWREAAKAGEQNAIRNLRELLETQGRLEEATPPLNDEQDGEIRRLPFNSKCLPLPAQRMLAADDYVGLAPYLRHHLAAAEREPDVVVAYALAFIEEAEIMLAWESETFDRQCEEVLKLLDAVLVDASDPSGAEDLMSRLVTALKVAPAVRDQPRF